MTSTSASSTSTELGTNEGCLDQHERTRRSSSRARSRSSRAAIVIALVVTATLLSGCKWSLYNGYDAPVGRRTCVYQDANMVHLDTTGFSNGQIADIQAAVDWLRGRTGVPLTFVAAPGENWNQEATNHILIERAPVRDGNGYTRASYSKPWERTGDQWYDGGIVWIDPSADSLPSWGRWGSGGTNFFKLMVHELSHQLGVADVDDVHELMGSTGVDEPGWGDGEAWKEVGC